MMSPRVREALRAYWRAFRPEGSRLFPGHGNEAADPGRRLFPHFAGPSDAILLLDVSFGDARRMRSRSICADWTTGRIAPRCLFSTIASRAPLNALTSGSSVKAAFAATSRFTIRRSPTCSASSDGNPPVRSPGRPGVAVDARQVLLPQEMFRAQADRAGRPKNTINEISGARQSSRPTPRYSSSESWAHRRPSGRNVGPTIALTCDSAGPP